MVLLGVRSAWQAELDGSPAELTFGTPLHLPGEMVEATNGEFDHDFLRQLKEQMNKLTPVQTSDHGTRREFHVPTGLAGATHVFIRRDARAPPLTRPCQGPFKVVKSSEKYFEVNIRGKVDRVSIDRLKRAHLEEEIATETGMDDNFITKRAEVLTGANTEPLICKKGRPRKNSESETHATLNNPETCITRYGRVSRQPDRL